MNRWLQWALAGMVIVVVGGIFFFVASTTAAKSRDIQRLSEIATIRSALERYFFMHNEYPRAEESLQLGIGKQRSLCVKPAGWRMLSSECEVAALLLVPAGPQATTYGYRYTSNGETYTLDFYIEKSDAGLAPGWHRAVPTSID